MAISTRRIYRAMRENSITIANGFQRKLEAEDRCDVELEGYLLRVNRNWQAVLNTLNEHGFTWQVTDAEELIRITGPQAKPAAQVQADRQARYGARLAKEGAAYIGRDKATIVNAYNATVDANPGAGLQRFPMKHFAWPRHRVIAAIEQQLEGFAAWQREQGG